MSRMKHVATAVAGLIFGAATVIIMAGHQAKAGPRITPARAEVPQHAAPQRQGYSSNEIIDAGHRFFGATTKGLARAVESVFRKKGRPTGYILGEEAAGAFIGGVRYGEGMLYLKTGERRKVFWQGPTFGLDAGGNGAKVLMLVYDIDIPRQIFSRFYGISGSAYIVGGLGVSYHNNEQLTVVPIRSGIGARLGASVGYLKMTARPTWNPF